MKTNTKAMKYFTLGVGSLSFEGKGANIYEQTHRKFVSVYFLL